MNLLPIFQWLQRTPIARIVRDSNAIVAGLQAVHLMGLCLLAGTILMVNLGLLGFGIRRQPVAGLAQDLAPWTNRGFAIMLVTGFVLFLGEAVKCYERGWFGVKMAILAVALIFHFRVRQPAAKAQPPVSRSKGVAVAIASLTLWTCVALAAKIFGI